MSLVDTLRIISGGYKPLPEPEQVQKRPTAAELAADYPVEDDGLVAEQDKCPACGEMRADYLVGDRDGVSVKCSTCGMVYRPGEEY